MFHFGRSSLVAITFVIILVIFGFNTPTVISQQQETGRCLPLPKFSGDFLGGYQDPICANVLRQSGYTHFWLSDKIAEDQFKESQGDNFLNPSCTPESFYFFETLAKRFSNAFTPTQPSVTCQNALTMMVCLISVQICDPAVDTLFYLSEERFKPCNWLCQIFHTQMDNLCTFDDLTFMKDQHQVNFFPEGLGYFPELNCSHPRYAEPGAESTFGWGGTPMCTAPTYLGSDPISPRCEPYTGTVCQSVFPDGTYIYVPSGMNQEQVEETLVSSSFVLNALPNRESSNCAADATRLYCQSMFRECLTFGVQAFERGSDGYPKPNTDAVKTTFPLPLNPPYSSCTAYSESCSSAPVFQFYSQLTGAPIVNCDSTNGYNTVKCLTPTRTNEVTNPYTFNQKPFFQEFEYGLSYFNGPNRIVYAATSFAASQINVVSYIPFLADCPAPLVLSPPGVAGINTAFGSNDYPTRCTLPCPSPVYSSGERTSIETTSWIFILFSLISSAILAATFLIFHSQRHKRLLFWYVVSYFGASLALFLGLIVRRGGSLWTRQCRTSVEYDHMHGFGLFQAIMLIYFLCASTNWWLMQALDLFQRLIHGLSLRRGSIEYRNRMIAMHLFCWITPVFVVVGGVVGGQFGYDGTLPFAWFTGDPAVGTAHSAVSPIILFFALIQACVTIGLIFIGIIIVYLARYSETHGLKKFHDQMEDEKTSRWFKLSQIIKLLGFAVIPLIFYVSVLAFFILQTVNHDNWKLAQRNWAKELVLSTGGRNFFTGQRTPDVASKMSVGFIIFTTFGICSQGFIMFILYFVLSADVYGLWMGILYFKCGIQCCKRWAKEDTTTGSGNSGSGDGSSHGSSQGSSGSAGTTNSNRSAVSHDLISGGGVLLTKRARDANHTTQSGSDGSSSGIALTSGNAAGSSTAPGSAVVAGSSGDFNQLHSVSKQPPRRGTLFKGMTKQSQDHRAVNRSGWASANTSGNELEMGSFGETSNDSFGDKYNEIGSPVNSPSGGLSPADDIFYINEAEVEEESDDHSDE